MKLAEHIDSYIKQKGQKTFNQCITQVLGMNDKGYNKMISNRKEKYMWDARLQEKRIKSYTEKLKKEKAERSGKNYLEFLNGNDMIKLKVEDNMYSIHKTRRDCKVLEDLNKRNNIYLSDIAVLGNDGLVESIWETSHDIDHLIRKIETCTKLDRVEVYKLLYSA